MLKYEQVIPKHVTDGAPLVVLMHGRGADRFDLLGLAPALAPDAVVVCPEAPWPGAAWGYGPGWAWYRFLGGDEPEPESFERSQRELDAFLAELPARLPVRTGQVALGGFSQGGVMSMGYALRNPGTVPAVVNFSGFLPRHPSFSVTPETVAGTRFFWGHGVYDQAIPYEYATRGRAALVAAGADLSVADYPIAHGISPDETVHAREWLRAALAEAAAGS